MIGRFEQGKHKAFKYCQFLNTLNYCQGRVISNHFTMLNWISCACMHINIHKRKSTVAIFAEQFILYVASALLSVCELLFNNSSWYKQNQQLFRRC